MFVQRSNATEDSQSAHSRAAPLARRPPPASLPTLALVFVVVVVVVVALALALPRPPSPPPWTARKPIFTMAANFAPYQDIPESSRALSPPLRSPRASIDRSHSRAIASPPTRAHAYDHDYFQAQPPPSPPAEPDSARIAWDQPSRSTGFGRSREDIDMFTTSLGWRLDYEACLAYLLLPPAGGVLLLMFEHQSDYVRFHAWQSSLLFAFVFVLHVIFSWSSFLSWLMLAGDLALIAWLTWRAYLDGGC